MSPAISSPTDSSSTTRPIRKHTFPTPKLRIHLDDLSHPGSTTFADNVKAGQDLEEQVQNVLNLLYESDSTRPDTRSVTFIIHEFDGLAYTTGTELDNDHKEIHFNLAYIHNHCKGSNARAEILGVLCHELVHCFQWNAEGTCPGGLIEGVADWVRLKAGLGARHWKKEADGRWDQGYQHTGFFLEYLEEQFGRGTVRNINAELREGRYKEEELFKTCCHGRTVKELWSEYQKDVKEEEKKSGEDHSEPHEAIPTHPAKAL